ncbi:MAG: hypothetical protein K0M56_03800 [Kaistella sp.]|nr:hypothetical protein [Kaistella sp.]
MKLLNIIFLLLFCTLPAQKNISFDSLQIKETKDIFADDYGNIYLYKSKDFSFTKYDSLGNQKGRLMFTLPFRIQSVQNPLNIPAFSENAQELKFYDQNLNEIQTVNFRQKFGFIKLVYAEDLQQLWLLDESTKRLIQYNFRDDRTVNSYPFDIDFEKLTDFLVFENNVYVLTKEYFTVYRLNSEKVFETAFTGGRRLRRENEHILMTSENGIFMFTGKNLQTMFRVPDSQIVDKNSASYFVIKGNKLYLYPIEKNP